MEAPSPLTGAHTLDSERHNPDLDEFMTNKPTADKPRRKRGKVKVKRDAIKQRAFKVLALLSDLDEPTRERVLNMAAYISSH